MNHIRICPICKKEVLCNSKKQLTRSIKEGSLCRSCAAIENNKKPHKRKNNHRSVITIESHCLTKPQCEKRPKKDLTGQIFNNWKILGLSHRENGGIWYWDSECTNCGFNAKRSTTYVKESKWCTFCRMLPKGETGMNKMISDYVYASKQRGLVFELTKEQFRILTSSPCYYCGCLPKNKSRKYKKTKDSWGDYLSNGIDRIDNNKGYIVGNCLTCCRTCNRGKGAWSFDFWLSYLKQFLENASSGKVPFLKENKIFTIEENEKFLLDGKRF